MFHRSWKKKLKALFTREKFITDLSEKGYNNLFVEMIYDEIYNYLPKSLEKNIYPTDDLIKDYFIDERDLEDLLLECFKSLSINFPSHKDQHSFYDGYGEDITVERLIQFVGFANKLKSNDTN